MHAEGGKIALQILHAGRYGYHPLSVAPSRIKSPITPFTPRELSRARRRAPDHAPSCAARALAREAGYDGVEVMGSEGYFINQFLVTHTNKRTDDWGGAYENRMRLPVEIVRAHARGGGPRLHHHLPPVDARPDPRRQHAGTRSCSWPRPIEAAGATIINTGIGWHEARVPTIATSVPRARLRLGHAASCKGEVGDPADHHQPHQHAGGGRADPRRRHAPTWCRWRARCWPTRSSSTRRAQGRADEINTCIACNQACLDHTFQRKLATCLVNPRACHETELELPPDAARRSASPWSAPGPPAWPRDGRSPSAATRCTCSTRAAEIGGQFNMAKRIPGKEEFHETLRYFGRQLDEHRRARCTSSTRVSAATDRWRGFDEVVLATGVTPRDPRIPGPGPLRRCCRYVDVLLHRKPVGKRVAIIGAGGIGFDVAEFLVHARATRRRSTSQAWLTEWGVADPGARARRRACGRSSRRPRAQVYLLQRKAGKLGAGLGKTTGWIHRATLKMKQRARCSAA